MFYFLFIFSYLSWTLSTFKKSLLKHHRCSHKSCMKIAFLIIIKPAKILLLSYRDATFLVVIKQNYFFLLASRRLEYFLCCISARLASFSLDSSVGNFMKYSGNQGKIPLKAHSFLFIESSKKKKKPIDSCSSSKESMTFSLNFSGSEKKILQVERCLSNYELNWKPEREL